MKVWKNEKRTTGILIRYTDKEKILLDFLNKNNEITLSKFRKIAGISRKVAEKVLADLIILQIIDMTITEKTIFYSLSTVFANQSEER